MVRYRSEIMLHVFFKSNWDRNINQVMVYNNLYALFIG